MRQIRSLATLALALSGLGFTGCGSEGRVKLVRVDGMVAQAGKPVAGAVLTFIPEPGNKDNTPGSAATDETGHYDAMWLTRSGLAPGSYKVMIIAEPTAGGGAIHPDFINDPYMAQLSNEAAAPPGPKKAPAPKQEFKADVTEAGGTFDFNLARTPTATANK
ncbi:carboxypeptidase-like regulatory domain-containing protein [Tundrisphaera sp. TA3]|uniref:carboxypeptidase-like regulatory domain-containing protein n=1 Tax=Tundrisphaera sp. TA3 TaxID=3435775 RepID=UPI003EB94129